MPSSSKIMRGLDVKGWKAYEPRLEELLEMAGQDEHGGNGEKKLLDPEEEKRRLLEHARQEAQELKQKVLEEARREAESLKEAARQEGYSEGFRQGQEEAEAIKAEAEKALQLAHEEHRQLLAGAEEEIVQIAVSLAEKVLSRQVEIDREAVLSLLAKGLDALPGGQEVEMKVHPRDKQVCRENRDRLQELMKNGAVLEIIADQEVPPGCCRIESEEAIVELMIQKELESLGRKLLKVASSSREEHLAGKKPQG